MGNNDAPPYSSAGRRLAQAQPKEKRSRRSKSTSVYANYDGRHRLSNLLNSDAARYGPTSVDDGKVGLIRSRTRSGRHSTPSIAPETEDNVGTDENVLLRPDIVRDRQLAADSNDPISANDTALGHEDPPSRTNKSGPISSNKEVVHANAAVDDSIQPETVEDSKPANRSRVMDLRRMSQNT